MRILRRSFARRSNSATVSTCKSSLKASRTRMCGKRYRRSDAISVRATTSAGHCRRSPSRTGRKNRLGNIREVARIRFFRDGRSGLVALDAKTWNVLYFVLRQKVVLTLFNLGIEQSLRVESRLGGAQSVGEERHLIRRM